MGRGVVNAETLKIGNAEGRMSCSELFTNPFPEEEMA